MELDELYQALERLKKDGEIVNAYGGSEKDIDHPDGLLLYDFVEYICLNCPDGRPEWLEAFYQVCLWQYHSMYEGVHTYYSNFYGLSDYQTTIKVGDYLKSNGYTTIAEQYISGIAECEQGEYPAEKKETAAQIYMWIVRNTEPVWEFYIDILEKHKGDWPESK